MLINNYRSIDGVEISQDNINEIGTLTDIEEL